MKLNSFAAAILGGLFAFQAGSVSAAELTKSDVEKIVREYLVSHPEILIEMSDALRAKQAASQAESDKALLKKYANTIYQQSSDPVTGNLKGTTTIVEFVDYNCGYCKRTTPLVEQLLKEHQDIRYIYKEFPILSDTSVYASKVALAVHMVAPEKYEPLHHALMNHEGPLQTNKEIETVVKDLGIDWAKVENKLNDPAIEKKIAENHSLAQALSITGTPAFIIGDQLLRGAPQSYEQLNELVKAE